ncbi:MAG TPA: universal stress protein [Jatrophihabitans sp.]|nr:universal stress protein [Jatrophihabitans sp.]
MSTSGVVLAVALSGGEDPRVRRVAEALTGAVGGRVRELGVPAADGRQRAAAVLNALDDDQTLLCVLAAVPPDLDWCWSVVSQAHKPVVLVPSGAVPERKVIARALLPLDGSAEAAGAVSRTVRLLDRVGIDLIVLHVFDATTVPACWDQGAHAGEAWESEFRARCGAPTSARLELRRGVASEHVVRAAAAEDVDLIALGWSQTIEKGRSQTVRATVLNAPVPVLLIPIGGAP